MDARAVFPVNVVHSYSHEHECHQLDGPIGQVLVHPNFVFAGQFADGKAENALWADLYGHLILQALPPITRRSMQ